MKINIDVIDYTSPFDKILHIFCSSLYNLTYDRNIIYSSPCEAFSLYTIAYIVFSTMIDIFLKKQATQITIVVTLSGNISVFVNLAAACPS